MKRLIPLFLAIFLMGCGLSEQTYSKSNQLKQPPRLTVDSGLKSTSGILGTYTWRVDFGGGRGSHANADAPGPLDLVKSRKPLKLKSGSSLSIAFTVKPDDYIVLIVDEGKNIKQEVTGNTVRVPDRKGLVVYEVAGTWKQGTAAYAFAVEID